MKIAILSSSYNGFTQRVHKTLLRAGHQVGVTSFKSSDLLKKEMDFLKPDVILSPFLKDKIPSEIFSAHKCLISHPGPKGDRGPSSIDWALLNQAPLWGATILEASEEMDAGDVYHTVNYSLDNTVHHTKSETYNTLYSDAGMAAIDKALQVVQNGQTPIPLNYNDVDTIGYLLPEMKQKNRRVNWEEDDCATAVRKVRASDGNPGANAVINGETFKLFGANSGRMNPTLLEGKKAGDIIAKSGDSVYLKTADLSGFWTSILKKVGQGELKLPATQVLEQHLHNVPDLSHDSEFGYHDVTLDFFGSIGHLKFKNYNGAMDSNFCNRLLFKLNQAARSQITHLVIEGGLPFSNGINLNTIEKAEFPEEEAWRNINLIDKVVEQILSMKDIITIASVKGSAGAGGVALAVACDYVVGAEGTVYNPHYRNMGLYGSEYWTYSFPRRIGKDLANKITSECLPFLAEECQEMKLIDFVLPRDYIDKFVFSELTQLDKYEEQLERKHKIVGSHEKPLEEFKEEELSIMRKCFFDDIWGFKEKRQNFVYKKKGEALNPLLLPKWKTQEKKDLMKKHEEKLLKGSEVQKLILEQVKEDLREFQQKTSTTSSPRLAIIQVGQREDSSLYVNRKIKACKKLNINADHFQFSQDCSEEEISGLITSLNNDPEVDGIMIQLPIPEHLSASSLYKQIDEIKNVEGIIFGNESSLYKNCLAKAVESLLHNVNLETPGFSAAVIGKSNQVGAPIFRFLSSKIQDCQWLQPEEVNDQILQNVDLIIVGCRSPKLIKSSMIKDGCTIIDVGINQLEHEFGSICGDADFEDCISKAGKITPVPGGVGPVVIGSLISNLVEAYQQRRQYEFHKKL